ncbi:ABC transporter substrate-binding protein [Nonomuraea sp. CA-143628]|uniref:ABC transporter substrate-binding protein n=1 Tax=Nonomuraea sp. CA-143628 TaxID=3239997 RepID=UPI003D908A3F
MTQPFRIAATGHSLNYLPEYMAAHRGYFEHEGLAVDAVVPSPWDLVLTELAAGTSQAALGGIWVPSMYFGRSSRYTPFAQVANRAPLALVGRGDPASFSLTDLVGGTVLMKGSNGASVGLYLKMLLAENDIDARDVRFIQDLDGAMLSELFVGGMGDYLLIDYPNASKLAGSHDVAVVRAFAEAGGDIPWSVYYTLREPTDEQRDLHTRFFRALGRGMADVLDAPADTYADLLTSLFPKFDIGLLVALTDQYRTWGMWTTPEINRAGYDRWQAGIALGGLVSQPLGYDVLIDSVPATRASREVTP